MSKFRFQVATRKDDLELREFGRRISMPGAIQLTSERDPSYFGALAVEGSRSDVLMCRDEGNGSLVAVGNRSIKPLFVDGQRLPVGYLSGLRIAEPIRRGRALYRGYQFLRKIHKDGCAPFYLTTIMETNSAAKAALESGRCGLPGYHDFGRFECMAMSLRQRSARLKSSAGINIRPASAEDVPLILDFLKRHGRRRQFFPAYQADDFGSDGGLLRGLAWKDLFLAFERAELAGTMAAWDQRSFRQWRLNGYTPWMQSIRLPYNLLARFTGKPQLPPAGATLEFFVLSLICIRDDDRRIFSALLDEIVRQKQSGYSLFLAGLHERDPLLPGLRSFSRYQSFPSRVYVAAWEDGEDQVRNLDRNKIPYLELGSL